jgi:hypothetical protein
MSEIKRISGDLAVRAVNFFRASGLKKDDVILCFDAENQRIVVEDLKGRKLTHLSYNRGPYRKWDWPSVDDGKI